MPVNGNSFSSVGDLEWTLVTGRPRDDSAGPLGRPPARLWPPRFAVPPSATPFSAAAVRSRNHHQYKGEAARPRHQSTRANRRRHHEDSRVPVCGAGCGVRGSGCAWTSAPTTSWPSANPCCAQGDPAWQRAGLLWILPIRRRLSAMTMANGFQIGITVERIQTPFG
ncbi:uncharacterized protein LOC126474231 [Schistocerca serialis cubense]|uniref:uncharacterized protein LOC126474231 n=1 Tax=Schistocerca serialis cubense TaxID=2023355 RepID=UPI00214E270A|nr:uncharacterized protein LOC126474231 [Schistocerca serialis cubense]